MRLVTRVAQRYADVAQREILDDTRRLLFVLFIVAMATVTGAHLLAVLHVFVVWALVELGVPMLAVLAGLLVADAVATFSLLKMAQNRLSQPLLPQTRAQITDLAILLSDD